MNPFLRLFVLAAGLILLTLCVFILRLGCSSLNLPGETADKKSSIFQQFQRREHLNQTRLATLRLREAKRQAVQEMIGRRASLAEMIAVLQALEQEGAEENPVPQPSREEIYRRILRFVAEILDDRPEEAEAVARRLEREFQQLPPGRSVHAGSLEPPEQELTGP